MIKAYANGEEVEFINDQANHIAIITIKHVDNAVDEYVLTYELADYRKVSGIITHKKLIDNDNIPQGQTLTLTDGVNTYTAVIGEDGSYEIEDVLVGSYTASIGTLAQYEANATATVVLGQDLVFDYEFNYRTINGHNANGNDTKIDFSQVNDGIISYVSPNKAVYSHFNRDMGDIKFVYFKFHEPTYNSFYPGRDVSAIGFNLNFIKTYNKETAAGDGGIFGVHSNQGYWRTRWQQSGGLGWGAHGANWDTVQMAKVTGGEGLGVAVGVRDDGGFVVFVEQADGHLKSVAYCAPETNKVNYIASIIGQLDVTITDLYIANSIPSKLYEDVTVYGEDGGSVEVTENNGLWGKTTVVATVNDGYKLDYFTVNGVKVDGTSYTIDSTNAISVKAVASFSPVEEVVENVVKINVLHKYEYETDSKAVPFVNQKFYVTTPLGNVIEATSDANGVLTLTNVIDGDYVLRISQRAETGYADFTGMYSPTVTVVDGTVADTVVVDRLVYGHRGFQNTEALGVADKGLVVTYAAVPAKTGHYLDFDPYHATNKDGIFYFEIDVDEYQTDAKLTDGRSRFYHNIRLEEFDADGKAVDYITVQFCNCDSRLSIKNTKGSDAEVQLGGVGGTKQGFYIIVANGYIDIYLYDGSYIGKFDRANSGKDGLAKVDNFRYWYDTENGVKNDFIVRGYDNQTVKLTADAENANVVFGAESLRFGQSTTITATANEGFVVTGIYANGVKLDAVADGANVVANYQSLDTKQSNWKGEAIITVTTAAANYNTVTADVVSAFAWDKYTDVVADGSVVTFAGDNGIYSATVAGGKISLDMNDGTYAVSINNVNYADNTIVVENGAIANDTIKVIKKLFVDNDYDFVSRANIDQNNANGVSIVKPSHH